MAVTLLIVRGPYVGQQIQVDAGQTFRIGRTERSEYAFPNDTYLSGAHFEVSCNESECSIRDLGSSNGTFLNGTKIDLTAVQVGDEVSAGETVFLVQGEGEGQAGVPAAPVAATVTVRLDRREFSILGVALVDDDKLRRYLLTSED